MDDSPTQLSLTERLEALAAYLPIFQSSGFEFAKLEQSDEKVNPYWIFSVAAKEFVQTCYRLGWVTGEKGFEWPEWAQTADARSLAEDPERMARATSEDLSHVLTVVIRQDRFVDGLLVNAFSSGLLVRVVQRAAALLAEISESRPLRSTGTRPAPSSSATRIAGADQHDRDVAMRLEGARARNDTIALRDRYVGSLLGLACGDAVGTRVEFRSRGSFPLVTDMVGGGPFRLTAGQWTDDTSMALCLAESLIECNGFDARDQMVRYVKWWRTGYLSSTGHCFDIGNATRAALERFEATGEPLAGSTDPDTAGNGSLMRLAPVVLYFFPDIERVTRFSAESSRTTHGAPEAMECCALLGQMIASALAGASKATVLAAQDIGLQESRVIRLRQGAYSTKAPDEISGSGYCIESLEAALWCFLRSDTFEAAVLRAVNLGDDADTTAAIVGQLAGAFYGAQGIPQRWLERLHIREQIELLAARLYQSACHT